MTTSPQDPGSTVPPAPGPAPAGTPTSPRPHRRFLKRLPALAFAAALLGGGISVSLPETHAQAAPKLCWYEGWFYQDGHWYKGLFKETC